METEEWPFDQAPNVAAITSTQVMNEGMPILLVTHYEDDHSWGFQSGHTVTTKEAMLVGIKEIVKFDPTVFEIAYLEPGYSATREKVGGAWIRSKDEWDKDE
ncbi:hypothetical protein [Puniceicoccus vermicola]|uniref:Uncharacterized protein n=1 Tax=Puniceicoccus vermicola TaxID=388746 RepID=A0A7X1AXD5_9BACT|nr:hypothetical protein [Puniceicoccus vermicola]MBC2600570.1 hypothetical protein [Puniceicoccus vermicola]